MIVNRAQLLQKRNKNNLQKPLNQYNTQRNSRQNNQNFDLTDPFQEEQKLFSKTQTFSISNILNQKSQNQISYSKTVTRKSNINRDGTIRSNNQSSSKSRSSSIQKYECKLQVDLSNKQLKYFKLQLPNGINYSQICSLNLSKNNIRQVLAGCLSNFVNLRQIFLNQNGLQKISFPYNKLQLKKIQLSNNCITNLNLQHIQGLQEIIAHSNKLIFITLPKGIRKINLDMNQLSNIYFVQKCKHVQQLRVSGNFVYDLNFNVDHEYMLGYDKSNQQTVKFPLLKILQASNNKISYFNGFHNIRNMKKLNVQQNEINFTRQNINQLFKVNVLQQLNVIGNPLQGPYDIQSSYHFIISKLTNLCILNNQDPKNFIKHSSELQNQSTIRQDQNNSDQDATESPYRLFIQQSDKKQQKIKKQWIFTLGDCANQDQLSKDNDLYERMINSQKQNWPLKLVQQKQKKISLKITPMKGKYVFNNSQKYLKTLGQIGIVPPGPILHSHTSKVISRRVDEDQDQYQLISKLFQNRNGVVYIKKFYNWCSNQIYWHQLQSYYNQLAQTGFISLQIDQTLFKKIKDEQKDLIKLVQAKKCTINCQPNIFSCYHIIASIRQNKRNIQAMNYISEDNLRFYYLVESKNI